MQHQAYITIEGKRLEYAATGIDTEAPTLVFLHEGLGCLELWRDFPKQLAAATGYGYLAYSRAGYGRSDPMEQPLQPNYLHQQAAVLQEVLEHFQIAKPVLVGHSDGASIALIYAGSGYTPAPTALILEAPHIFVEGITLAGIEETVARYENSRLHERLRRYHGDKTEATFRAWSSAWQQPEFRGWSIEALLPGITSPTQVIQGSAIRYLGTDRDHRRGRRRTCVQSRARRLQAHSTSGAQRRSAAGHGGVYWESLRLK